MAAVGVCMGSSNVAVNTIGPALTEAAWPVFRPIAVTVGGSVSAIQTNRKRKRAVRSCGNESAQERMARIAVPSRQSRAWGAPQASRTGQQDGPAGQRQANRMRRKSQQKIAAQNRAAQLRGADLEQHSKAWRTPDGDGARPAHEPVARGVGNVVSRGRKIDLHAAESRGLGGPGRGHAGDRERVRGTLQAG